METFFIAVTIAVFIIVIAYKIGYAYGRRQARSAYIPPRPTPNRAAKDYYETDKR